MHQETKSQLSWAEKIRRALRAGRVQRFKPKEQLIVVWVSHIVILLGVWVIMAAFRIAYIPPLSFLAAEGLIIVMCLMLIVRVEIPDWRPLRERWFKGETGGKPQVAVSEHRQQKAAGVALGLAYALQFAALLPLLAKTGGPIDSPFGQMAVAFAIFTPFIANNWMTTLLVLAATIAYYAALIMNYGFNGSGHGNNPIWAYFSVNVMFLVLAVGLTLADLVAREARLRKPDLSVDGT